MEYEPDFDYGNGTEDDYYYDYFCGNESYWQVRAEKVIELYIYPIVIIVGSLCNILAIVVLQAKMYRWTSTGFLLTALAFADLGLLLTGITRRWVSFLTGYELDFRNITEAGCKFHIFFTYFCHYMSAWTLALLTIERAIHISFPFKYKNLCSLKKIIIGWVVILVVMFAVNAHFFRTYGFLNDAEGNPIRYCDGFEKFYAYLFEGGHHWVDLMFPSLGPFVVILASNIVIIVKRKNLTSSKDEDNVSTTIMLLLVSFVFLLCGLPFSIYSLGISYYWWPWEEGGNDCATHDFVFVFCYLLFNLNSAVNFFLYYVSGARFRRAFMSVFCPKKYAWRTLAESRTHGTAMSTAGDTNRSAQLKNGLSGPPKDNDIDTDTMNITVDPNKDNEQLKTEITQDDFHEVAINTPHQGQNGQIKDDLV